MSTLAEVMTETTEQLAEFGMAMAARSQSELRAMRAEVESRIESRTRRRLPAVRSVVMSEVAEEVRTSRRPWRLS